MPKIIEFIEFIEKTISAQLANYLNDPELFELVKKLRTWRFSYGRYFPEKSTIAKPDYLSMMKSKQF